MRPEKKLKNKALTFEEKVRQENLLLFADMYEKNTNCFRDDIESLFSLYNPKKELSLSGVRWGEYREQTSSQEKFSNSLTYQDILEKVNCLIQKHEFGPEWLPYFSILVTLGEFDVPYMRYVIRRDENNPHHICIVFNNQATEQDIRSAYSTAQHYFTGKSKHKGYNPSTYKSTEDAEFIRAVNATENECLLENALTTYDKIIYDKAEKDQTGSGIKAVNEIRKKQDREKVKAESKTIQATIREGFKSSHDGLKAIQRLKKRHSQK